MARADLEGTQTRRDVDAEGGEDAVAEEGSNY